MATRPEHTGPAEEFYDASTAEAYTHNSRVLNVQTAMTERAVELLNFPPGESKLLLDLGCGSGICGSVLSESGHHWVGMDISPSMLQLAADGDAEGDLALADMGQGFGFRTGVFDGAVSISALQWLCYVSKAADHSAKKRIGFFFSSLYKCLRRGARAVLQLYPEAPEQLELITSIALRSGFSGGLVVDYPNSRKARKHYLCLFAGLDGVRVPEGKRGQAAAAGVGAPALGISFEGRHTAKGRRKSGVEARAPYKSRNWVLDKKASQRRKGAKVRPDTKYTARKRKDKF